MLVLLSKSVSADCFRRVALGSYPIVLCIATRARLSQERRLSAPQGRASMAPSRASADLLALNDLVRDRVQRAGAFLWTSGQASLTAKTAMPSRDRTLRARSPDCVRPPRR